MSMVLMKMFSGSKWSLFQATIGSLRCRICNAEFLRSRICINHSQYASLQRLSYLSMSTLATTWSSHLQMSSLMKMFGEYWGVMWNCVVRCWCRNQAKGCFHSVADCGPNNNNNNNHFRTVYNPSCGISKIVRRKGGRCRGSARWLSVRVGRHWKRIPLQRRS